MKTRFKCKSPIQQIYEWRNAYVQEYDSMPTIIEMDARSWDSVLSQCMKDAQFVMAGHNIKWDMAHICGM